MTRELSYLRLLETEAVFVLGEVAAERLEARLRERGLL
jgi:hypothetical protein